MHSVVYSPVFENTKSKIARNFFVTTDLKTIFEKLFLKNP